jgi:RNA polymerase sigma factor (sigma-70 family)
MDDWSLLQQYAHRGSKEALDTLVRSYLPMVYAAALRRMRDRHLAEDVTQVVFLVLMRRAGRIKKSVVLGGWLYQVTAFTAANLLRSERRRQCHEQKAAAMKMDEIEAAPTQSDRQAQGQSASEPQWSAAVDGAIGEALDEAIDALPRKYRDAVVMRYLQGKSIHEVAEAQHLTDNAARQRLFRALAKLRRRLARSGIVETEDRIGAALTAAGAMTPAADLVARIVGGLHAAAVGSALSPVVTVVLRSLIMAKLKSSLLVAAILLILLGIGGGVLYTITSGPASPIAPSPSATPPIAAQPAQADITSPPVNQPANPAAQTPVDGSPNAAVISALAAFRAGNIDGMITQFEPVSQARQDSYRAEGDAVSQFRAALTDRFGAQAAEQFMERIQIDPSQNDINAVRRVQPKIDGDRAEMTIPHMGAVHLVKIDGAWKLSEETFQDTFSQFARAAPMLERIGASINDGKFSTIGQVRDEFKKEFSQVMNPDPSPPPDRPAVLAPGETPQATLAAFDWAMLTGNEDAAIACLLNPSPSQQNGMRLETRAYYAGEQVRAAVADKFGPAAGRDTVLKLGFDTGLSKSLLDSVPITISGDKAQVDLKRILGQTLNLQKVDGVWKIEPIWDMHDPIAPWGALLRDKYVPALEQLAADVKAGKFQKRNQLDAAVAKFNAELKADYQRVAAATSQK